MLLGFPAERLLEMRRAGGPLAPRHHAVISGLLRGLPAFEYSPDEAIAMRDWWRSLPASDDAGPASREVCVAIVERALVEAKRCLRCAGELTRHGPASARCPKCG